MLVVPTYTGPSKINGTGLFAKRDILRGETIWVQDPSVDLLLDEEDQEKYKALEKFFWENSRGEVILPMDDDRYTNHSRTPNRLHVSDYLDIAGEFIPQGTEITIDYRYLCRPEDWSPYF